jgi:hypothetical protein
MNFLFLLVSYVFVVLLLLLLPVAVSIYGGYCFILLLRRRFLLPFNFLVYCS